MVKENRTLQFSNQEILSALQLFKSKDLILPNEDELCEITLEAEPDITLILNITTENGGVSQTSTQTLNASFIAAVMLRY